MTIAVLLNLRVFRGCLVSAQSWHGTRLSEQATSIVSPAGEGWW